LRVSRLFRDSVFKFLNGKVSPHSRAFVRSRDGGPWLFQPDQAGASDAGLGFGATRGRTIKESRGTASAAAPEQRRTADRRAQDHAGPAAKVVRGVGQHQNAFEAGHGTVGRSRKGE